MYKRRLDQRGAVIPDSVEKHLNPIVARLLMGLWGLHYMEPLVNCSTALKARLLNCAGS